MKCPQCGRENAENSMLCRNCGSRMEALQSAPVSRKKHNKPFFKRTGVRVTAIVLAVVLVAASVTGVLFATHVLPFGKNDDGDLLTNGINEFKLFTDEDVACNDGVHYVKEQLAVTADKKYSYADVERIVKRNGGDIVGCIEFTNDYQLEFAGADYDTLLEKKEKVAAALEGSEVELHEAFEIDYDETTQADPQGGNWWRSAIRIDELEREDAEQNRTYENVKVGIVDSCFYIQVDELKYAFDGGETFNNEPPEYDTEADPDKYNYEGELTHGTKVAGFLAAAKNNGVGMDGVANNVTLYGFSDYNSEIHYYVSMLFYKHAFATLFSKGCKIISMSIGMPGLMVGAQEQVGDLPEKLARYSKSFEMFLQKYIDANRDFIIVKSAGNTNGYEWYESVDEDGSPSVTDDKKKAVKTGLFKTPYNDLFEAKYDFFGAITSASVQSRIIIVGSSNADFKRSDHSVCGDRVDVYAPGHNLRDILGNEDAAGTSFATPIVAGVAALIWGANPDLPPETVKNSICVLSDKKVEDIPNKNVVDAYQAVNYARGAVADPAPPTEQVNMVMGALRRQEGSDLKKLTESAVVDIYRPGEETPIYSKLTDNVGGFTIAHLAPGNYEISAEDKYGIWCSGRRSFTLNENDVTYIDDFNLLPPTAEIIAGKSVKQIREYMGNEFTVEFGGDFYGYTDGTLTFRNDELLPGFLFSIEEANSDYYNISGNGKSTSTEQSIKRNIQNGSYDSDQLRIAVSNSAQFIRGVPAGQRYSQLSQSLHLKTALVTAGLPRITQQITELPPSIESASVIYEERRDYFSKSGQNVDDATMDSMNLNCDQIICTQSMSYVASHPQRNLDNIDKEDEVLR